MHFDPHCDCRHADHCSHLDEWDCNHDCTFLLLSDVEFTVGGPPPKLPRLGLSLLAFRQKQLDTVSERR